MHAWRYSPEDRLWTCSNCLAEAASCPHPAVTYSPEDRLWTCPSCGREWRTEPRREACG